MSDGKKIRITLVKSIIDRTKDHIACVRGLGLSRREQTVELVDTPAVRGMINKVSYLVKVGA